MNLLLFLTIILIRSVSFLTNGQENVAIGKIVRESSSKYPYSASLVVDGLFSSPFCFRSLASGYQKIIIDLIWLYRVDSVGVYGKLATTDLNVGLATQKSMIIPCYNLTSQLNETNVPFSCPDAENISIQKIIIDQTATCPDAMVVCEVVVEGRYSEATAQRKNLLLNKTANMSSTFRLANILTLEEFDLSADLMVDGMRDPIPRHGHCAHTNLSETFQNWIQVDMGKEYHVDYVALSGREVPSISVMLRLSNFIIGLTSSSAAIEPPMREQYPLCGTYPGDVPVASRVTLQCNANLPAYRFIIAHQAANASDGYFSVCELEAYEALLATEKMWTSRNDQQLLNYIFMEFEADRPSSCVGQCMGIGEYNCDSFNFNHQMRTCQLNQHRNGFLIENLVTEPGWTFWNATYPHLGSF